MDLNYMLANPNFISVEDINKNVVYDFSGESIFPELFGNDMLPGCMPVAGSCNETEFFQAINPSIDFDLFETDFSPSSIINTISDPDPNQLALNDFSTYSVEKRKKTKSNKKAIPLSSSVGIGTPQRTLNGSYKLEIAYDLEKTYRPRYKTDYFALNGIKRKPRYVTDRLSNHYVSIRVPPNVQGQIRIDWLTIPDANGSRFVMPYKFQANNDCSEAEDLNPIYENIIPSAVGSVHKLYLVLIKAKQDSLKTLQPLQAFRPFQDLFGFNSEVNLEKTNILPPKKLIQKYQLEKSQLAFTLCILSADGQSYVPEWDTTVYSTVLEEESSNNSSGKMIACPQCSAEFNITDDMTVIDNGETNKRKNLPVILKEKPKRTIKKQKSLNDSILSFY